MGLNHNVFPLNYLTTHVSHYCLDLILQEMERSRSLDDEVYQLCGCAIRNTHQIPCACELRTAVIQETPIGVDRIHQFWRSLTIDQSPTDVPNDMSEDLRYFYSLGEELKDRDPIEVRAINCDIHEKLFPDQYSYDEPAVKTAVRGRPSKAASMKTPSTINSRRSWGRGRSSNFSRGRSSSSSSSVNQEDDIHDYIHRKNIPSFMFDFISGYLDVIGDGNCGFRVMADALFGKQDSWRWVRQTTASELRLNPDLYGPIYGDEVAQGISRISWSGGMCDSSHWMEVIQDLFPIATFYNVAIIFFSPNVNVCCTVLPLRAPASATQPEREIGIAHLGTYMHYIRLKLIPTSPMPPVAHFWFRYGDQSVRGWDNLYRQRLIDWGNLCSK